MRWMVSFVAHIIERTRRVVLEEWWGGEFGQNQLRANDMFGTGLVPEDKSGKGLYRHDAEGSDDMPVSFSPAPRSKTKFRPWALDS